MVTEEEGGAVAYIGGLDVPTGLLRIFASGAALRDDDCGPEVDVC